MFNRNWKIVLKSNTAIVKKNVKRIKEKESHAWAPYTHTCAYMSNFGPSTVYLHKGKYQLKKKTGCLLLWYTTSQSWDCCVNNSA